MIDKKYEITDLETVANELYADKKHYQLFWEKTEVSLFPFLKKEKNKLWSSIFSRYSSGSTNLRSKDMHSNFLR